MVISTSTPFRHGPPTKSYAQNGERDPMAGEQFSVVLHEGRWKIEHNGQHSRPYETKAEAIKSAIDQANEMHEKGLLASVSVQSEGLVTK
jgi:hypothetical protein